MAVKIAQLTEKQVLKKLNIPDFRHLSKDKIMTFFSMLPNMDSEVAKKAIEQFPTYASTVKEIVSEYKGFLEKAFADNAESVQSYVKQKAFAGCTELKTVKVSEGHLSEIGDDAFKDCVNIRLKFRGKTFTYSNINSLYGEYDTREWIMNH